jgi:DNA-binding CsgD family transcriptional regulator
MMNENQSNTIFKYIYDESNQPVADIKAFHYEKAIEGKLSGQNSMPLFECCLIDFSGKQFACIHEHCSEPCTCRQNEELLDNLAFHELQFHPVDRMLWSTEAYPDILRFIDSSPANEISDFRFIFNHRYIHKDESISQFMHEGSIYLADNKSLPSLKLNVFAEIGDFKTDETLILTIFSYSDDLGYRKVFRKVYGGKVSGQLSQREMEIIRLCHQGYSGKMIAEKLNLSLHTVKNHKRNCMEKTFTHNITELIHLCLQNGWL